MTRTFVEEIHCTPTELADEIWDKSAKEQITLLSSFNTRFFKNEENGHICVAEEMQGKLCGKNKVKWQLRRIKENENVFSSIISSISCCWSLALQGVYSSYVLINRL